MDSFSTCTKEPIQSCYKYSSTKGEKRSEIIVSHAKFPEGVVGSCFVLRSLSLVFEVVVGGEENENALIHLLRR